MFRSLASSDIPAANRIDCDNRAKFSVWFASATKHDVSDALSHPFESKWFSFVTYLLRIESIVSIVQKSVFDVRVHGNMMLTRNGSFACNQ